MLDVRCGPTRPEELRATLAGNDLPGVFALVTEPAPGKLRVEQFAAVMKVLELGFHEGVEAGIVLTGTDVGLHVQIESGVVQVALASRPPLGPERSAALHGYVTGRVHTLGGLDGSLRCESSYVVHGGSGEPFGVSPRTSPSTTRH